MKTVLIIGMGKFAHRLCENMVELGNEVMIIDQEERALEDLVPVVTSAKIGDCTNVEVLKSLGVDNFDIVFVCISENFQNSLEITSLVKELGAKYVISKADRDIHAKFLLRNGADEVVYPDRDIADKLASRCSVDNIFDYIELTEGYAIYEIPVKPEWVGKTIVDVNFRKKYNINILGIKSEDKTELMPGPSYKFSKGEHLMVMSHRDDIEKVI